MRRLFSGWSLGPALAIPLVCIFCAGTALIAYVAASSGDRTARELVARLSAEAADEASDKLDALMRIPMLLNTVNVAAIESGILDIDRAPSRDRFFAKQLAAFPQVSYSFYGREDASFYGARRNEADEIEAIHNDASTGGSSLYFSIDADGNPTKLTTEIKNFDCRTRPWYKAGIAAGEPIYSEVYRHFVYRDLAVTASYPIRARGGAWDGVLGVDFRLDRINGFLSKMSTVPGGGIVVVERSTGLLVGNSLGVRNYLDKGDSLDRLTVGALPEPFASVAAVGVYGDGRSMDTASGRIRLEVRPFRLLNLDWIILVAKPYAAFTGPIVASVRLVVALSAAAMLISVAIGLYWFRSLTRPIRRVVEAADRLAQGEWNYTAPEGGGTYRELSQLAHSFNAMAAQLRASISGLEESVAERTRELAGKNLELSQSNESKDRFIAILAHDLRNPVGALTEALSAVADGSLVFSADEWPLILKEMAATSRSVSQLLENLLDWAGSQRGTIAFQPQSNDIALLAADAMRVVGPSAAAKRIALEHPGGSIRVSCDANMVRTIVRNLLSNAVKFTPPGGRVSLSVEETESGGAVVSVADTGVGIPEDKLADLFSVGRATKSLGTAGEKGTGLGLLVCKEFAERNGGRIEVSSEVGRGSVFRLVLPGA